MGLRRLDFVAPSEFALGRQRSNGPVSVGKLDAAGSDDPVISGGEPENESKYHEAKKWIRQHGHCGLMASEIAIDEGDDRISVIEGRDGTRGAA